LALQLPSASNVFVPGYGAELGLRLAVEYTRNWKDWPFLMCSTKHSIPTQTHIFKRIDPTGQGRVIDNPQAYIFNDGDPRPMTGLGNQQPHEYVQVTAKRRSFSYYLGDLIEEFSPDEEQARVVNALGNAAMTEMALDFYSVLNTAGNYLTGHTDTATNLGGGTWDAGTATNPIIKKTLAAVRQRIDRSSYGTIDPTDLILLVGPELADKMGRSAEIQDGFYRQEGFAEYLQYKTFAKQFHMYGLPPVLYGFTVLVDNTVRTSTKVLGSTTTTSFLPTTTNAYILTRPGALKGDNGNTAFSSIGLFEVKGHELKVEVFPEPHNRRALIAAETYYTHEFTGKEGSFLVTGC